MKHLDDDTVALYAAGKLPPARADAASRHLSVCDSCRERVTRLQPDAVPATDVGRTLQGKDEAGRAPLVARGTSLGRYLVLDPLGRGGMGEVYSAYDPELNRRVAIKLLRVAPGRESSIEDDQARLLREAQAMARLSHPNVVAVYDVGAFQGGIFIAMELVEGRTLKDWLSGQERSWRETLALFLAAGRGLAAAHTAGLVHRDFKPQNVLVGNDGRVRVTDFGLARASNALEETVDERSKRAEPADERATPSEQTPVSNPFSTPLTLAGTVMGTPGYMPPEQIRAEMVDARGDQFSFCASLFEALYDDLPFPGVNLEEVRRSIEAGKIRAPPRGKRVPAWLRAMLVRGLAASPDQRFPSMDAFLDSVEKRMAARRQWAVAVAALAIVSVVGAGSRLAAGPSSRCGEVQGRLAGVWDSQVKATARAAFDKSALIFARDSWAGAEKTLDAWARDWTAAAMASCEAGRQNPKAEMPRLQDACLEDRLLELKSLTQLLSTPDQAVVMTAVSAAASLTPSSGCADSRRLHSMAETRGAATPAQFDSMRRQLAQVKALRNSRRFSEGLALAKALVDGARTTDAQSMLAEGLYQRGSFEMQTGDYRKSVATLDEADLVADAAGMDWLRVENALEHAYVDYFMDDLPLGFHWIEAARARLKRIGGDDGLELILVGREAGLLGEVGRMKDQLKEMRSTVTLARAIYADAHPRLAAALTDEGGALAQFGYYNDASKALSESVTIMEKALGRGHPDTLVALAQQAEVFSEMGKYAQAAALNAECLPPLEKAFGPDNFRVSEIVDREGTLLLADGDAEGALARYQRVEKAYEKGYGADNYYTAMVVDRRARALRAMGRPVEAKELAQRALSTISKGKAGTFTRFLPLETLGELALDGRRFPEASKLFSDAVSILDEVFGSEAPILGDALTGLGESELALGHVEKARTAIERAMSLREGQGVALEKDARTRFALARTLASAKPDDPRGTQLAEEARQLFTAGAKAERAKALDVEKWLAARSRPRSE